jgi:hypothetical protein
MHQKRLYAKHKRFYYVLFGAYEMVGAWAPLLVGIQPKTNTTNRPEFSNNPKEFNPWGSFDNKN